MPTKMIPPTIAKMESVKDNIKISLCVPVPSPHKDQFQNLLQLNSTYRSHFFANFETFNYNDMTMVGIK